MRFIIVHAFVRISDDFKHNYDDNLNGQVVSDAPQEVQDFTVLELCGDRAQAFVCVEVFLGCDYPTFQLKGEFTQLNLNSHNH